jgi:hypothetical protein
MNPLDDLISSSARVPGGTADELGRGRAALDEAIAARAGDEAIAARAGDEAIVARAGQESPARRKASAHWFGGLRGKAIVSVAAVAAVAAATTAIAVVSSPARTPATPLADASAKATVKASAKPTDKASAETKATATPKPKATGQVSTAPVTYSITATKTNVTAAYVFAQAAKGTQAAQEAPDGNVPLVNGWPNSTYWHTVQQGTNSACPGLAGTFQSWLAESGAVVAENESNRRIKTSSISQCGSGNIGGAYPVSGGPAGPMIGGQVYTWAQFAALPTDPAKLWPIVAADESVGVASEKGEPEQDFLFQTIGILLTSDPVSPAMRMALYELAENIPGVTVAGTYTDSLGRTGTALSQDSTTEVIDTSNGQVLATLTAAPPLSPGCVRQSIKGTPHATCAIGGASTTVYISAGPVNSEPNV